MNDERYTFISDVREKKRVARGYHNKRTHCGKGGAVKFPSDYLSKKELKAMNGEVKSYRLNDPMTWKEFRTMPDDIKIVYIKTLREKFGAPDSKIAEMMGTGRANLCNVTSRLGIGVGSAKGGKKEWDEEGFAAWVSGEKPVEAQEVSESVSEPAHEITQESCENAAESVCEAKSKAIPLCGGMTFEGRIEDALNAISVLLGGGKCSRKRYMGSPLGR